MRSFIPFVRIRTRRTSGRVTWRPQRRCEIACARCVSWPTMADWYSSPLPPTTGRRSTRAKVECRMVEAESSCFSGASGSRRLRHTRARPEQDR
eukprot:1191080-Prorocentrum_minimum.AAC.10